MIKLCYISVPIGKSYTDLPKDFARIILSPVRHQGILWISDCLLLVRSIGSIGSFQNLDLKMSSASLQPFCLGHNVLCHNSNKLRCASVEKSLRRRHNERDVVSNHQPHDGLLNRFIQAQIKEKVKFRVTGLCAGNSPVAGEFPAQRANNAENVSIW